MKARIHITLKKSVLDPQGKAIENSLNNLGFHDIKNVRQGKYIEIELLQNDKALAHKLIVEICEKLLANTVIEDYSVELEV